MTADQIGAIVDIQIGRLDQRLSDKEMQLVLTEEARQFLADKGYDPVYGARPLKRAIQKYIENELSLAMLQGTIQEGDRIRVDTSGDRLTFRTDQGA